nr:MAG TPA: hypothetical protein [Caudoviricetes sp.]
MVRKGALENALLLMATREEVALMVNKAVEIR